MTRLAVIVPHVRGSFVAAAVLALSMGYGCAGEDASQEGAFVDPPGFTPKQTAKVALRSDLFYRDGGLIRSTTFANRVAARMAAGEAVDANSEQVADDFRIEATFRNEYHEGMRVNVSSRPGAYVDVVPQKAQRGALAQLRKDRSVLAFVEPYRNVTATFGGTEQKVEEFLSIPSAEDIPELTYELVSGPDFGWWTEGDGDGYLYAFAKDGKALFALDPPSAEDAVGKTVTGTWKVSVAANGNSVITADIALRELTFPVLLDPTFETPQWYNATNGGTPSARAGAAGTYRPTDGCILLFGGSNGSATSPSYASNMSTRCNGTWGTASMSGDIPSTRGYAAMSWAPGPGKVFLFGGFTDASGVGDDFYSLTGSVWTRITKSGTWPTGRFLAGGGHDGTNFVLFGGVDSSGNNLTDTWIWDGSTWSVGASMAGRYGFASAQVGNSIYAIGGYDGDVVTNTVQRYEGGSWNMDVSPLDAPIPTTAAGAVSSCIDPGSCDSFVNPQARYLAWAGATPTGSILFGAGDYANASTTTFLSDAWLLREPDATANWLRIPSSAAMSIGPRESGTAVFDTKRNELIIVGGYTNMTGSLTSAPRLYKGRADSLDFEVICAGAGGSSCDAANDNLVLRANIAVTNGQAEGYFVRRTAAGSWESITDATGCGSTSSPVIGATISCTVSYPYDPSTGTLKYTAYGVRVRDHRYHATTAPSSCVAGAGSETSATCVPAYVGGAMCEGLEELGNGDSPDPLFCR